MAMIGFEFPLDSSGQWDGFNDPGIEHFAGNRLQHLGREVPQNTIDAKISSPARISVSLRKVPVSTLPGVEGLKYAVKRCVEAALPENSEKAVTFFENASKLLAARDLNILQLRDSNTTGLKGPCVNGTPFFAMLKATGQSQKVGTSTGSYGIGKFAPFAVSELRTVFVTTVWADRDGQKHHYVQGKSILMSHRDAKGNTRRGTGFWGLVDKCQPVTGLVKEIPKWLRLTGSEDTLDGQLGTMLTIVGFTRTNDWQRVLTANIVENFFGAISRGELEVQIEGGPEINSATIHSLLADTNIKDSVSDKHNEPEKFENAANYLRVLAENSEVQIEKHENYYLGECELRILVGENLPRRVAVLRNGMLITEQLPGLKRFGDFKEFAAVLECHSEKGNTLLRAMEPPRHDAFEPDRLPVDRRHAGRTALRELAAWVKKMLARHAKDPVAEETNLDELAIYFGEEDETGSSKRKDENPWGAIIIRARPVEYKSGTAAVGGGTLSVDDEGDGGDDSGDGEGEGDEPGGGSNTSSGGNQPGSSAGGSPRRTLGTGLNLRDVRAVPISANRRKVAFTPGETGKLLIELQDSGADTNYALQITASNKGEVRDGRIEGIQAVAGERCTLEVELAEAFQGTLRVVANAI